MNASPPYLRVGPVAIHLHSREVTHKPTPPSDDFSLAGRTLDVQGAVFMSPDDGTSIQELNGVVRGFLVCQGFIFIREWCLGLFQHVRCFPVNRPIIRTTLGGLRSFPLNSFLGFERELCKWVWRI